MTYDNIPSNERPDWASKDDPPPAPDFQPLGQIDEDEEGWQQAPKQSEAPQQASPTQTAPSQPTPTASSHDDGDSNWWIFLLIGLFVFKGFGDWGGNNTVNIGNYWWLIFLWGPISGFVVRAFNVEKRIFAGLMMIAVAVLMLVPISTTGLVGLGLLIIGALYLLSQTSDQKGDLMA